MMQVAMLFGFTTSFPANRWLLRKGTHFQRKAHGVRREARRHDAGPGPGRLARRRIALP
jgi:hypothetical protein